CPYQEADLEPVPVDLAVETHGKVGSGVADHLVIRGVWPAPRRRPPIDAARAGVGRRAEEHLLPGRVDAEELGAVERAQRITRAIVWISRDRCHDALGLFGALSLAAVHPRRV